MLVQAGVVRGFYLQVVAWPDHHRCVFKQPFKKVGVIPRVRAQDNCFGEDPLTQLVFQVSTVSPVRGSEPVNRRTIYSTIAPQVVKPVSGATVDRANVASREQSFTPPCYDVVVSSKVFTGIH